jgi:OOP family OmpA-OmpF porin
MSTDVDVRDSTNPMINVGVGMMHQISERASLRADVRYRMDMDDESIPTEDDFSDFLLNVGLVIAFGGEEKSSSKGALIVTAKDSDNDGVSDDDDRCPGTAAGIKVDENGCELDSDNDGVVDSQDQCPDSKPGVNVDTRGCELQQSFILKGVNFVTGSDVLTPEAKTALAEVAATLKKNSDVNVEVAGYTDDRGNANFNKDLSQKRAESVKAYLESSGVDSDQMTARGYGEESPVADNETADGRKQNRRVELHILD